MRAFQRDFIAYALECGVLRFGDFQLKSGRRSPYFFNTGLFDTGARLGRLGEFYAQAIVHSGITFDVLYGPAYKGIPLVCATAIALSRLGGHEVPFAFNRKEPKDHGEGGAVVGATLRGEVLIVDDVITAGTSVRESVEIISAEGAVPAAVLVSLDRQEKGNADLTAIEEVERSMSVRVHSIVTLDHVILFLQEHGRLDEIERITRYRNPDT